jgi:hypothetical protein
MFSRISARRPLIGRTLLTHLFDGFVGALFPELGRTAS